MIIKMKIQLLILPKLLLLLIMMIRRRPIPSQLNIGPKIFFEHFALVFLSTLRQLPEPSWLIPGWLLFLRSFLSVFLSFCLFLSNMSVCLLTVCQSLSLFLAIFLSIFVFLSISFCQPISLYTKCVRARNSWRTHVLAKIRLSGTWDALEIIIFSGRRSSYTFGSCFPLKSNLMMYNLSKISNIRWSKKTK